MSNETTLDDVPALVADWRRFGKACANKRDGDQYLVCADELEALLPAIKAALEDARRLDALEAEVAAGGPLTLHNGEGANGGRGLGLSNTRRSLRRAIDQCCGLDAAQEVGREDHH